MKRILLIFCAICAWAQSGIDVPTIGAIVDPTGSLRPVQGVSGNFLLGPATASGILSATCSEHLCLAKTDSKILSSTGETDAPPGSAIFAMTGDDAIVFFPESRKFARWHDNTLDSLDWMVEGDILSIRLVGSDAEIAVRRDGTVWVVRPDGAVLDWIAKTSGPVLLLPEAVVFATSSELVLRDRDGSETLFDLLGAESISVMGPRYAAIYVGRAGPATYALRTERGHESLFLLPGNTP